ncbi:hypothetical protein RDI58_014817 [Solanum bulbocastanum]|uniref:Uncharacterized protein n=1 Tax=Solanum bulbocastanum TaxID=147425 RepID=A0AAN8TJP6_SOLBU
MSILESLSSSSISYKFASFSSMSNSCKSLAKVNMSPTLSKILSCKYNYLYEVDVLPPENKISSTYLPLLNPYSSFVKESCNPWMQIRSLVQQNRKGVNEYVATVVPELYSLKDDNPTNNYLSTIDDYLRCDLDDLNLEHLDDIDLEHDPEDKSSLESDEEDDPPIFMNHHKEPDVSAVE